MPFRSLVNAYVSALLIISFTVSPNEINASMLISDRRYQILKVKAPHAKVLITTKFLLIAR